MNLANIIKINKPEAEEIRLDAEKVKKTEALEDPQAVATRLKVRSAELDKLISMGLGGKEVVDMKKELEVAIKDLEEFLDV